ncbi:MAG: glycosyltransferase [Vicinamibacterales bacterium]
MASIVRTFSRLFAFDHGLGNLPGHWVHFHRLVTDEARRAGLEVNLFGYSEIRPELVGDLPVWKLFRHSPATCFSPDITENTRLRNEAFLADLQQLAPHDFGPGDVFLFTFVMNYELEGILRFARLFERAQAPTFVVLLQFDNGLAVLPEDTEDLPWLIRFDRLLRRLRPARLDSGSIVGDLYRDAVARGRAGHDGAPVVFMAPSHGLDGLFARILREPVHPYCMPGPRPSDMGTSGGPIASTGSPRVCFLGHSCIRKGLHLVPEVVELTHRRLPDVRFDVQVNYNDDYPLRSIFEGLFDQQPRGVQFHRGHLDTAAFYDILNRADIVLCPYSRDVYAYMPSGLLREALALGKVVVLPAGTSLERQAVSVQAAAVAFSDQRAADISLALDVALAQLPELKRKAAHAALRWNAEHNPTRFMDQILLQAQAA